MIWESEYYLPFLRGEKINTGLKFTGRPENYFAYLTREEILSMFAERSTVLHKGCADHPECFLNKLKRGVWLHEILQKSAKNLVGVDINKNFVNYIREKGFKNCFYADIEKGDVPKDILNIEFDYILMPDVIEHLDNPVSFLKKLKKTFRFRKLIISTPNAYYLDKVQILIRKKVEIINSDHRYSFTPYTLLKVAVSAGYDVENFFLTMGGKPKMWYKLLRYGFFKKMEKNELLRKHIFIVLTQA